MKHLLGETRADCVRNVVLACLAAVVFGIMSGRCMPQDVTITNPSERAGSRWIHDLAIAKTLRAQPVRLAGKASDSRAFTFRKQRETGTHWIYSGFGRFNDGEDAVRVKLVADPSDSWLDAPLQLHPQLTNDLWSIVPRAPDLDGQVTVWANGAKLVDNLQLTLAPLSATTQQIRMHASSYATPFRFDLWVDVSSYGPAPRVWFLTTVDGWNDNVVACDAITVTFNHEITFPYQFAHDVRVDFDGAKGAATWVIPGGKLSRCTAPIALFDAHLVSRGGMQGKLDEDELGAFRFNPARAWVDGQDGHVSPFGPAPVFTNSVRPLVAAWREHLTQPGSWTSKRRFGSDTYPNSGGTKYPFGVVSCPELYGDAGYALVPWMLESAIGDAGNRNHTHLTRDGEWWTWVRPPPQTSTGIAAGTWTWGDKPDSRHSEGDDLLGGQLPGRTVFGWGNYDGQHAPDTMPAVYGLTGDPLLGVLLRARMQMQVSNVRVKVPWVGVPRETGRILYYLVRACDSLGDVKLDATARDSIETMLRQVTKQWRGKTRPAHAYLREFMTESYGGGQSISPWQTGLGLLGMHAAERRWGKHWRRTDRVWHTELQEMLVIVSRTGTRLFTLLPGDYFGVGTPYFCYGSDSSDPDVINNPSGPSTGELYALWTRPSAAVFLLRQQTESKADVQHAEAIMRALPVLKRPVHARWTGVR